MKNVILFSILFGMVLINYSSCQKPPERQATVDKKIASDIVNASELADATTDQANNTEANTAFMKKAIAKITDLEAQKNMLALLEKNKLDFVLLNDQVDLLEIKTTKGENLHTVESLMKLKKLSETTDPTTQAALKIEIENSLAAPATVEIYFSILAKISIKTGILENDTTDYNEKKSILKLTETTATEATHLILNEEIKADVSDDE